MVKLNGAELEYDREITLGELVESVNSANTDTRSDGSLKIVFEGCIVIINSEAVAADQAQGIVISDNDTIYIVPKLDGG